MTLPHTQQEIIPPDKLMPHRAGYVQKQKRAADFPAGQMQI
jgi:hypothetical protein